MSKILAWSEIKDDKQVADEVRRFASTLKIDYSKKELFGVTEVTFGTEVTYFVKMQDSKNWITIKIDPSGNSSVHEKYKKG